MFLSKACILTYLKATEQSRCFKEGLALLEANHVLKCSRIIGNEDDDKIFIQAYSIRTSQMKGDPAKICGCLMINNDEVIIHGL